MVEYGYSFFSVFAGQMIYSRLGHLLQKKFAFVFELLMNWSVSLVENCDAIRDIDEVRSDLRTANSTTCWARHRRADIGSVVYIPMREPHCR